MKIIRIDRKSIRRNPNAGETQTIIQGRKEITFSCKDPIPLFVKHLPFIITEWEEENGKMIKASGVINGPIETDGMIALCNKAEHLQININNNIQVLNHMPEAEYLYEYQDASIKCKQCKNLIDVDGIEDDYIFDGEDEHHVELCPVCGAENSFPVYEYEKITNIPKSILDQATL